MEVIGKYASPLAQTSRFCRSSIAIEAEATHSARPFFFTLLNLPLDSKFQHHKSFPSSYNLNSDIFSNYILNILNIYLFITIKVDI